MDRRDFLLRAAAATAGTAGLAGCLGDETGGTTPTDEPGGDDTATEESMDDGPTTQGDGAALGNHPAAEGLAGQPRLGPPPGEATGTIIAYEDPSCPRCAVFELETVPKIRSELVEPGDATFVFRGYPVQPYPWGEPAAQALEAVADRDADAHWALAEHYFGEQDAFDEGNVLDRTRTFLAEETGVDGDAVVADVEDDAFQDRVDLDLRVGRDAGAGGVTPTVFLFRDGQFQTKARGSVSFTLVKSALGL